MSGTEYNYDDQGQFFPYFVLTITGLLTLPTTYSLLKPSKVLENKAPRIQTDYKPEHADLIEGQKRKQKRKEFKLKRTLFSAGGWLVMAYMVYLIVVTARTIPKIWDPYDVLGVARAATEKQIKSHYRKMSLLYHPDKVDLTKLNQTVDEANEHWVEVTKAFKALTDEEVRNNYLQYGHPDGKQSFSIGIALPKWIVEEGYGKYTLAFYLALLGVFLPWLVGRWWYGTQKVTKDGVLVNSAGTLFREYKEDMNPGSVIGVLSGGDEFQEVLPGSKADAGLAKLEKRIAYDPSGKSKAGGVDPKSMEKLQGMDEGVRRKALGLLWAYLGRVELDDATLDDEKYEVGPTAFALNEAFMIMCLSYGNMQPLLSSFRASQCLIQALTPGSSPLLQLPYITSKIASQIEGEGSRSHMTVQDFMALSPATRRERAVGKGLLTDNQLKEAEHLASQLPLLKVEKAFFKVEGERFITPNSLVQFVIKCRVIPPGSKNVPTVNEKDLQARDKADCCDKDAEEGERITPPLANAPYYARDHSPRWHVFLGDSKQNKIAVPPFTFVTFDKPLFKEDGTPTYAVQTFQMQFGAPPQAGQYNFTMQLLCDSYVGMDTKMDVTLMVEDQDKADETEEDEISEPEEDSIAGQMKAMRSGKSPAGKHVHDEDEDSSDGSNTEGDDDDDDTSETDTDTDTDEE